MCIDIEILKQDAYTNGIHADHRIEEYEGFEGMIECPLHYTDHKELCEEWWRGFGDGTEDFISNQRSQYE